MHSSKVVSMQQCLLSSVMHGNFNKTKWVSSELTAIVCPPIRAARIARSFTSLKCYCGKNCYKSKMLYPGNALSCFAVVD